MPWMLARLPMIRPGLSSVAGPLRLPIMLILPPTRMAPNDLREGAGAADLDHVIDAAAAGELHRRLLPVRRGLVVDGVGGAELLRLGELVVARRGDDRPACPSRGASCRPNTETPPVPCSSTVWPAISLPCSIMACHTVTRGAGQGRALLQRQVRRDFHRALLLQHDVFRQHAVDGAAERGRLHVGRRLAAGPALRRSCRRPCRRPSRA